MYKFEYLTLSFILLMSIPTSSYYLAFYSDSISFKIDLENYFVMEFVLIWLSLLSISISFSFSVFISIKVNIQN